MQIDQAKIRAEMERVVPILEAIGSHIKAIQEENDREVITVYIDAIQELENRASVIFRNPQKAVRKCIKIGSGDFKKIQRKCLELNLV